MLPIHNQIYLMSQVQLLMVTQLYLLVMASQPTVQKATPLLAASQPHQLLLLMILTVLHIGTLLV